MSDSKLVVDLDKFKELYKTWCSKNISWNNFLNAYSGAFVREVVFKSISCDCLNCRIIRDNKSRVFVEEPEKKVEE